LSTSRRARQGFSRPAHVRCHSTRAIRGQTAPNYLSTGNDPLYRFPQWRANLRVLEVTEIKTVPYVPLCHPFVELLIGTVRRECLDRTLFWTTTDLEEKVLDFQHYYNEHRTHAGRQGQPPVTGNADRSRANLSCYRWQNHCGGLYQTPIAA
jgi:putative transposase